MKDFTRFLDYKREWLVSGPHDGTPPWSVGLSGIGPILWFDTKPQAEQAAQSLNHLEDYLMSANPQ